MLNHLPVAVQVAVAAKQVVAKAVAAKAAVDKGVASPEVEQAVVAFNPQKPDPGRPPVSKR